MLFVVAGLWQDRSKSTLGAVHGTLAAHESEARRTKLDSLWRMFLKWHGDDVLLRHPNYNPRGGESQLVYHPPIMNCSTAAYEDVGKILERIGRELTVGKDMKAVLCVGGQQTFSRMWHLKVDASKKYAWAIPHLKVDASKKYAWAIPCSGDFHYQFHVASGINRAAYGSILKGFVDSADMPKTASRIMDDSCNIKCIDHFYQLLVTKSVLTYLTGVYGQEDMIKNPGDILEEKRRTWVSAFLATVRC